MKTFLMLMIAVLCIQLQAGASFGKSGSRCNKSSSVKKSPFASENGDYDNPFNKGPASRFDIQIKRQTQEDK